jgi:hypothetical protein
MLKIALVGAVAAAVFVAGGFTHTYAQTNSTTTSTSLIERFNVITNCKRPPNDELTTRAITRDGVLKVHAFPDGNAEVIDIPVRIGDVIESFTVVPENAFRCSRVRSSNAFGWVVLDDLSRLAQVDVQPVQTAEKMRELLVQCTLGNPKSDYVLQSMDVFTRDLRCFKGCAKRPTAGYIIGQDNRFELQNRLMAFVGASNIPGCPTLLGKIMKSMSEELERLRTSHPNCVGQEPVGIPFEVTKAANLRVSWIEGTSSDTDKTVPAGLEGKLYHVVGSWGFGKFNARRNVPAVEGWIHLSLIDIGGDVRNCPVAPAPSSKKIK